MGGGSTREFKVALRVVVSYMCTGEAAVSPLPLLHEAF